MGFNEPTLTTIAYVCYILAFISYGVYLLTRAGRAVAVARPEMALAGVGAGTVDVDVGVPVSGGVGRSPGSPFSLAAGRIATGLVVAAWVSLTTALVMRTIQSGHAPYVTLYEITTMLVWGMTTVYLVLFELALKTRAVGAFALLIIASLETYAVLWIPDGMKTPIQLVPALRSYWLMVHVSNAIVAYSAFGMAAGAGLTLMAKHYLKGRIGSALPSEAAIEEFMFRAVAVGFPFQTLLLITGAIWAQEAWTKAWSWDPKEVWALVTWLVYAAYLHVRVQRGVRGITMAWLSLIGFAVVLITFAGVNYMVEWFGLSSMHTYSTENGNPDIGWAGLAIVLVLTGLLGLALFSWLRVYFPTRRERPIPEKSKSQREAS